MRLASATVLALTFAASAPAHAGAQVELRVAADVRARPGGPLIASLMPGARVTLGAASGSETQVTFEGWVDANRLGAKRDSFPASVSGRLTLRLRSQPSARGQIIATLQPGTGLHTIARQGSWARVRRTAWMQSSGAQPRVVATAPPQSAPPQTAPAPPTAALAGNTSTATRSPAPTTPAIQPAAQAPAARTGNAVVASSGARFRDLPVGRTLGGLTAGSAVEIVARSNGWVRVRTDGWVQEKELVSGQGAALPEVSAADLRADPAGMKGRVLQWDVEVMSLQIADPLRVELERDEPYLLARGPGAENTILYLAVPPTLLTQVKALPPLARVNVTVRVRSGRSEPAGTPILDLLSIGKR